ncbi:hypothetical protein FisN_27Lh058 [Fistulifera solaris]|uniref:Uncharacterized protein n=1 Tax=Fistulifera solaris TaxID=1519565 RepID=A0A1Z5JR26_FISSO|nr:hypothetical protein FisN_27Lh058 [Fistulifera solaris]|eukprot:GAX16346.1 hypothetical protein FisN_27Lh058 [Fistulifera solaris]
MKIYRLLLILLSLDGGSSFTSTGVGRLSKRTSLARKADNDDNNNNNSSSKNNASKGGSSKRKDNSSKASGANSDNPPRRRSSPEGDPLPFAANLGKESPKGSKEQTPRNVSPPMPRPGSRGPRRPPPGATWDPRSRMVDDSEPPGVNMGPPTDRGFTRIGVPGEAPSQRKRFDFARGVTEDIFQSERPNGPRENGPRPDLGSPSDNYNSANAPDSNGYYDNRSPSQRSSLNVEEGAVFNPADTLKGVRIKETNSWSDNAANFNRGDALRGARIPNNPYERGFDVPYGPGPYARDSYMDPRMDPRGYNPRPPEYDIRSGRYNGRMVDDKYASWPAAKSNSSPPRTDQTGYSRDGDSQQSKGSRTEQSGYNRDYDSQQYGGSRNQPSGYGQNYDTQRYNGGYGQQNQRYGQDYRPPRDNYYYREPPYNGMYPPGRPQYNNNFNYPPPRYDDRYYGDRYYGDGFWRPDTYRSDLGAPGSYSSWRSPLSPNDNSSRKEPWDWSS